MVFCLTESDLTSGLDSHSWTLLSSFYWIIAAAQKKGPDSTWAAKKERRSLRDCDGDGMVSKFLAINIKTSNLILF